MSLRDRYNTANPALAQDSREEQILQHVASKADAAMHFHKNALVNVCQVGLRWAEGLPLVLNSVFSKQGASSPHTIHCKSSHMLCMAAHGF